jgi:hypothetical protein
MVGEIAAMAVNVNKVMIVFRSMSGTPPGIVAPRMTNAAAAGIFRGHHQLTRRSRDDDFGCNQSQRWRIMAEGSGQRDEVASIGVGDRQAARRGRQ